ncbi:hypothetical protein [Komarekiella delphini-convector]|uniref:hypothetical protein n=1 Tax=Komarekiella delphini-convector TaxID=3050158 RepID=UPI001785EC8F|nr:hypothetical protein [Komarekiella delphini-convector]
MSRYLLYMAQRYPGIAHPGLRSPHKAVGTNALNQEPRTGISEDFVSTHLVDM